MTASVRFLTLREAAAAMGLHPNTLRAHAKAGVIPGAKCGRDWRFVEADLVAWLRDRYPERARMQLSADEKEALWHSGNVQELTMLTSQARTEAELDDLLARPTGKKRGNTTTG